MTADPPLCETAALPPLDPRDEEILKAAFAVFTEYGFHGATMLEVAKRARASKSTLYARFKDKEGLFHALLSWGATRNIMALQAVAEDSRHSPEQALLAYAIGAWGGMTQPQALAMFRIAAAEGGRQPEIGRIFERLTRDIAVKSFRVIAERLRQSGCVAFDDPAEFGDAFIGLLRGSLYNQMLLGAVPAPTPAEVERHARRAVRRLLRAFAPERDAAVRHAARRGR